MYYECVCFDAIVFMSIRLFHVLVWFVELSNFILQLVAYTDQIVSPNSRRQHGLMCCM